MHRRRRPRSVQSASGTGSVEAKHRHISRADRQCANGQANTELPGTLGAWRETGQQEYQASSRRADAGGRSIAERSVIAAAAGPRCRDYLLFSLQQINKCRIHQQESTNEIQKKQQVV